MTKDSPAAIFPECLSVRARLAHLDGNGQRFAMGVFQKLVEAAGVEPASEIAVNKETPCVAASIGFAVRA
jgi:hypothetical protein